MDLDKRLEVRAIRSIQCPIVLSHLETWLFSIRWKKIGERKRIECAQSADDSQRPLKTRHLPRRARAPRTKTKSWRAREVFSVTKLKDSETCATNTRANSPSCPQPCCRVGRRRHRRRGVKFRPMICARN